MCAAKSDVRFAPNSDRESGFPQTSSPLYSRKRTCAMQLQMSAMGQKRTFCKHRTMGQLDIRGGLSGQSNPGSTMEKATQVSHCLAPARARAAINSTATAAAYARMFPELPSFEADEAFLHALGRTGGLCDGGD